MNIFSSFFFSFALQYVTWWHSIPCAFVDWFKKQHLWIILLLGSVGLPCVTLTCLVLLRSAAGSCREAGVMHVHAFRTFMTAAAGWGAGFTAWEILCAYSQGVASIFQPEGRHCFSCLKWFCPVYPAGSAQVFWTTEEILVRFHWVICSPASRLVWSEVEHTQKYKSHPPWNKKDRWSCWKKWK